MSTRFETWTTRKATHANVHGTEAGFGGYRATVYCGNKVVSSQHFAAKGWGSQHINAAYQEMKTWVAAHGVA